MLDHIPPTIFWPLLVVVWFLVTLAVGILVGKCIKFGMGD
jgi:hypothetical protein